MMKILQNNFSRIMLVVLLAFGSLEAGAQILGWDAGNNGGGFGVSPWSPVTQNTNVTTSGLVRGSAIATSGSPAGGAWGGSGGWVAGSGVSTDANSFHFTVVAASGYKISLSGITTATRRSNSGPTGYTLYYSVNGSGYVMAGTATTSSTSGTTGTANSIALSGIAALQNVAAGTVIKFRINPDGTTGNYYLTGSTNSLRVNGTVVLAQPSAPVATAATTVTAAGFTANWNAVAGATGYRLDVSTDAAFANILENYDNFAVATGTSQYVYMGIEPNTTYYYRVRAEIDASVSNNSNVISIALPACGVVDAPVASAQAVCEGLTISSLSATGTGTFNWYTAATGGTALPSTTLAAAGTYYVSQTIAGCESNRVSVAVTLNPAPAAPVAVAQSFCGSATVASLLPVSSGSATMNWYAAATGGIALASTVELANGTYYVSQTVNGCESPRTSVQVTINTIPAAPVAVAQLFCGSATVAGLQVTTGTAVQWYTAATGGTALVPTTALATGTYYASQTVNGCEGPRAAVEVTVNPVPAAPTAAAQLFCGTATAAELVATGSGSSVISWYDVQTGGTALAPATALATGTYYVTQSEGGCESTRTAVAVTVNPVPVAPVAEAQVFCGATTIAGLTVTTGEAPLWYAAETGGTALAPATALATGTYYVSQTVNGCESPRASVMVTINEIPAAPLAAAQLFCGSGTVSQLAVTTGTAPKWYIAETGGTALTGAESLTSATYYVSQTINNCESPRTAVVVTVNTIPAAPAATAQAFCASGTVGQLTVATGTAPKWYAAETGGVQLDAATAVATGTYYVSQTVNGCESARTAVTVTINPIPAAPLVVNVQTFCNTATVADLDADGVNVLWYTTATGGTALTETAAVAAGTSIYYASQTINGCESTTRAAVAVQVNTPAAPSAVAQAFCGTGTVSQLAVTSGTSVLWYSAATGGTALTGTTALATGTYYVSQTLNGCESAVRTAVTVTVNPIPAAPTAAAQSFCGSGILSQLVVTTGTGIQWYAAETGGTALAENTALATGNYYVSQMVNGCESARTMVAVTVNPVPATPETTSLTFCNAGTVSELTATTGTNLQWYMAATGGTALAGTTPVATGIYYVSQTVNGCESVRTAVAVTLNITPAPTAAAQVFCGSGTVGQLMVIEGTAPKWYASETGGTQLEETTALATGTYYVSQTLNACESPRTAVSITVNVTPAPTAEAQSFCHAGTVADLEVTTGTAPKWYAAETGGTQLEATAVLADGTYYVSQTLNDCEGSRAAVVVTIVVPVAPVGDMIQEFTEGETLAALEADGENIVWYAEEALTTVLPETTVLVDGTTYYAVATEGECSSVAFLAVTVDEVLGTKGFDLQSLRYFPNPVNDRLTLSYGEAISSVTVYNLLAQPVLTAELNATTGQIEMSSLAAGTYILKIASGDTAATIKVVKR